MPIAAAFERHGEQGFREREAEVVGSLLEEADGGAIALGGGSVLSERIRAALGRHVVVWLQVDAQESWRRIAHSDRPLATNAEDVARLMAVREPLYEELADAVIPVGDRGDRQPRAAGADRPRRPAAPGPGCCGRRAPPASTRSSSAPASSTPWPARTLHRLGGLVRGAASASPTRPPPRSTRSGCSHSWPRSRSRRGRPRRRWRSPSGVLRELARAGMTQRGPRGRARRRRRRRSRRASAPTSTSAGCRWSRCRRRWSPRSTPPTAARPASTCPRARTTPAPTTCPRP